MKKNISLLLAVFILLVTIVLSSCEKDVFSKEFYPQRSFALHMTAKKDMKEFEADIVCKSAEELEIVFTKPEELSGFSVKTTKDGFHVNVFGIPEDIPEEEIKDTSLLNMLTQTIKTAVFRNHGEFHNKNGVYSVQLTIDETPVSVSFTNEGFLKEIIVPSIDFSAVFEYSG